ncbi:serine protease [Pontibacillus chungwhensis BH030062]|uniref:Serine protease n=1 Tax=Pontibacillus chungwhensis BH030062 TaxID=1385513 RepID=A0A0A2UUR5_9BACI|nr:CAP-associated domain-containing protein [Pontibacillus chungwhensis]KGP90231.1 serine protease [Pontibacillus chungwhensis BH030062]
MPKLRRVFLLLLIAGGMWYIYGDTFNESGVQGVYEEMKTDVVEISQDPEVRRTVNAISLEVQSLFDRLTGEEPTPGSNPEVPDVEKPSLDAPSDQSFSVHNIELGDTRQTVEEQAGAPKRASLNEYGVNWVAYHENYQNFFMVAYNDQNQVVGLYTNQDLVSSKESIQIGSSKQSVQSAMPDSQSSIRKGLTRYQVQNKDEYDLFNIDQSYVTVFYDKHEQNTVTAVQIISEELEQQKEGFFGEPSAALKEGFEYQLFDLTNAARVEHGLGVLSWDEAVKTTARDHSKDMAVNNYFSHTNPEGQSPFDRMTEDGIAYRTAGENLAAGQSSSIFAHEGLMNSIGHRENILHKDFERLAVGVAFNEEAQPYYTENFLTK